MAYVGGILQKHQHVVRQSAKVITLDMKKGCALVVGVFFYNFSDAKKVIHFQRHRVKSALRSCARVVAQQSCTCQIHLILQ